MKKVLLLFVALLATMALFGCKEKEFKFDGTFLAYQESVHRNAPQVVFVTVTIENNEIVGYKIDTRQGRRTGDGAETPYAWAWNAQTKLELGDAYNMKAASAIGKEWYEQAAVIEAFWLANGLDAVEVNADNYITNIAGASMADAYTPVAKMAVENARAGKFVAIYTSGTDLYSAELTLNKKGQIETLLLDVLQSTRNAQTGTFEWRPLTKQELGNDYAMKGAGGYVFRDGAWVAEGSCTLEWWEQAQLITDYITANGWSNNLQPVEQRGGSLNGTDLLPELAGATIRTAGYFTVLKSLFEMAAPSVK